MEVMNAASCLTGGFTLSYCLIRHYMAKSNVGRKPRVGNEVEVTTYYDEGGVVRSTVLDMSMMKGFVRETHKKS